ncbi:MAG: hypothetical protein CM1200mP29_14000 [Verrucomicrobiota bacterium]|nr:MAG: hypothetical protein CM1200mP29_14000 [Verrucomicrobiota bacterium]
MRLNGIDPGHHDFIYGDALDWMKRLAKRGNTHDLVILDPPTFSRSKKSGSFQAKRDYPALAKAAAALVRIGGMLLACCKRSRLSSETIQGRCEKWNPLERAKKSSIRFAAQQPPDFPVTAKEPAYLKVLWLRLD